MWTFGMLCGAFPKTQSDESYASCYARLLVDKRGD